MTPLVIEAAINGMTPRTHNPHVPKTPDEVAAKIASFAEIGAERVYLQVLDLSDLDHLGLIAAEVAPQV